MTVIGSRRQRQQSLNGPQGHVDGGVTIGVDGGLVTSLVKRAQSMDNVVFIQEKYSVVVVTRAVTRPGQCSREPLDGTIRDPLERSYGEAVGRFTLEVVDVGKKLARRKALRHLVHVRRVDDAYR